MCIYISNVYIYSSIYNYIYNYIYNSIYIQYIIISLGGFPLLAAACLKSCHKTHQEYRCMGQQKYLNFLTKPPTRSQTSHPFADFDG